MLQCTSPVVADEMHKSPNNTHSIIFVSVEKLYIVYSFHESKQQEHGRRHFFPIPGESVEWQSGEYLCPLCECYGNTVLPLLPHFLLSISDPKLCRPCKVMTLADWRELVSMTIELAGSEDAMDTGELTFDLFRWYM